MRTHIAHAVSQRDDVTIAPFHCIWQIIQIISDIVRLIIRNFTLVDLTRIDCQMPTIREKEVSPSLGNSDQGDVGARKEIPCNVTNE